MPREVPGVDLDVTAPELARAIGGVGLLHHDVLEQARRDQVERHHPLVLFGARDPDAVDFGRAVAFAEPAHEHELPVVHRHAGHPPQHLGRVLVRGLPHLLGAHRVADRRRLPARGQHRGLGVLGAARLDDDFLLLQRLGRERGVERQQLALADDDSLERLGRVRQRADAERPAAGGRLEQERAVRVGESADPPQGGVGRKQQDIGEPERLAGVGRHHLASDLSGRGSLRSERNQARKSQQCRAPPDAPT